MEATEMIEKTTEADTQSEKPEGAVGQPVEDLETVDKSDEAKKARPRNYSFKDKNPEKFDEVEVDGQMFAIPATIGSTYWAVLKVMYENANKPVYPQQLTKAVEELMTDRDPDAWDKYTGREETTVFRRVEGGRGRQKIKPWQDRVINNAKTLTRIGGTAQYGKRLLERGHVLRFEYDDKKRQCFRLHTNLDCLKKKQVAQPEQPPAEPAEVQD